MSPLWSPGAATDRMMLDYTVGEDRTWDARLLRWDVLGSLGHIEGLLASGLLTPAEHRRLRSGLRKALRLVEDGTLRIGQRHEDAHSAIEMWLTARWPDAGQRLHTGRSRNDQVACDLRLYLKHALLELHAGALALAGGLVAFAARHRGALLPGYTHQRRAMPSSVELWAGAYAEGILDTLESLPALWARVDRSPLGSAAGYGVPLPLRREVAALYDTLLAELPVHWVLPGSTTTWRRRRTAAASSRPRPSSGAASWGTTFPASRPTSFCTAPKSTDT